MPRRDLSVTPFQGRVYEAVRRIPKGKVISYAALASAIGCRSARVVGQALRRCPFDDVPCHRVIASGRGLGGYGGRSAAAGGPEIESKRRRLQREGIRFDPDGRILAGHELRDSPALSWLGGKT